MASYLLLAVIRGVFYAHIAVSAATRLHDRVFAKVISIENEYFIFIKPPLKMGNGVAQTHRALVWAAQVMRQLLACPCVFIYVRVDTFS